MMVWNTIHFLGMGLGFAGALLQAFFASSFRIRNEHLEVNPNLAKVASKVQLPGLWMFAIGFMLLLFYEMHLLQIG